MDACYFAVGGPCDNFSHVSSGYPDHATVDAVRTLQRGNPLHGYTCTAFAHGANADGSLLDESRNYVSFEYTVQPIDNEPEHFVVTLKRY